MEKWRQADLNIPNGLELVGKMNKYLIIGLAALLLIAQLNLIYALGDEQKKTKEDIIEEWETKLEDTKTQKNRYFLLHIATIACAFAIFPCFMIEVASIICFPCGILTWLLALYLAYLSEYFGDWRDWAGAEVTKLETQLEVIRVMPE